MRRRRCTRTPRSGPQSCSSLCTAASRTSGAAPLSRFGLAVVFAAPRAKILARGRPLSDRIRVLAAHRGPSPPRRAHPRGSKRWWSRWLEDVLCVQRWLAALLDVGYEIPPIGATEAPAAAATGPADDVALQPCRSVIPAASAAAPQPAHGAAAARQPSTRAGDLMGSSLCAVRGLPGEVEPG